MTAAASVDAGRGADAKDTFRLIRRHFSPALSFAGKFAGQGAVEVSAGGSRVQLSDGRSMLDFGSYAVTLLGHRHPAVVAAVQEQLGTMPASTRSLANTVPARAAERLVEYLGAALPRVYFGSNGADAVEVAVKLARLATGRDTVVAVRGGFHGKTMGALALTHNERFRSGLDGLLGGVVHVDADDPDAIARVAAERPVAAVVFEPVQGENGVIPLDVEVLRQWCEDAHAVGAFAISDEIQVGLRRCGARSVALAEGLPVDAVLLGKPLGGGVVPLSAAVCSDALYQPLLSDPVRHTATFGGMPLCTAALPAALDVVEEHAEHGVALAERMHAALTDLHRRHPDVVSGVRGRGLAWGLDLATPEIAGEVQIGLAERGLLVSPCLSRPETLRLLPPLVASLAEIDQAAEALDGAAAQARAQTGGGREEH
ncbi:aspartate aminotransferase family protein [Streptomyces sp. NPDC001933]|uniref:aspartate aminotransferase family protein n=1 Tax=Streptomyces sp. NPDC001933 TaxID=3364626 RepID=UPI0036B364C8